jgi:hypothetical protein
MLIDQAWRPPLAPIDSPQNAAEALQLLAAAVELRETLDRQADVEGRPRLHPPLVETYDVGD